MTSGVRSVQRALEILALLGDERPAITVRDVMEHTGLARTTAARLMQTLVRHGLLWPIDTDPRIGFVAGPSLLRWAHLARRSWEMPPETRQAMRDLAERHGETVNLFVARGTHRVCVAQEEGFQALRHVVHVGDEQPLWAGASSKVLLRNASDATLDRVAAASPFGEGHARRLREWADEAAVRGYAVSHSEHDIGLSAVAVPIFDNNSRAVASLSLSGPTHRFSGNRIAEFAADLARVAKRISQRGFHYGR
jgi:DNA-binding IclR family transcriptional regulator